MSQQGKVIITVISIIAVFYLSFYSDKNILHYEPPLMLIFVNVPSYLLTVLVLLLLFIFRNNKRKLIIPIALPSIIGLLLSIILLINIHDPVGKDSWMYIKCFVFPHLISIIVVLIWRTTRQINFDEENIYQ